MSKGTTRRTIRIEDGLWEAAKATAERQGVDLSETIRMLVRAWVNTHVDD